MTADGTPTKSSVAQAASRDAADRDSGRLASGSALAKPRLGFAGVGWIGRMRMQSILESGCAQVVAVADPSGDCLARAAEVAPGVGTTKSFSDLLDMDLDGVVIATPSAMHAEQTIAALRRGMAVFCQKPLARSCHETARVIEVARSEDRRLGVDMVYRTLEAVRALHDLVQQGELGTLYAGRFVFHNAYGPDKPWFYDRTLSGGGCVMDLGTHLVDLALWLFGLDRVIDVRSRLFANGRPLGRSASEVEDYASVHLDLASGASVEVACSWNLPAGRDAVIEASLYGTAGGAQIRNVGGSFYDFEAELDRGTSRRVLCRPPDAWGGRAIVEWAEQLPCSPHFDPRIEDLLEVASVVDRIYGGAAA
jgi:predicted dehydrogenase